MSGVYPLWPSPLDANAVAAGTHLLAEPRVGDDALYWLQSLSGEGGRVTLMRAVAGRTPQALIPAPYNVRSRVNEYGGGAWTLGSGNDCWFVNGDDQALCRVRNGGVKHVFRSDGLALGDLAWDAQRRRVLAVAQTREGQRLVAIGGDDRLRVLAAGADFYAAPRPSPDGRRLVWLEWSDPDMPWDATRLMQATVSTTGDLHTAHRLAGGARESLAQPEWSPTGNLHVVSDRDGGFWNLYRVTATSLRPWRRRRAECARPAFVFAQRLFAFAPEQSLILAEASAGLWRVLEGADGDTMQPLLPALSDVASLHAGPAGTAVLGAGPTMPLALYFRPRGHDAFAAVATSLELKLDPGFMSQPKSLEFVTADDETAHALYFPPAHPEHRGAGKVAVRVRCHGGPTAATSSALEPKRLYWTSRGFGVLELNYRGSTGYGRAYREALYGRWGVADAADARAVAWKLIACGIADPARLTIAGSSAGGLTVLNALSGETPYAAGASYYGVADLTGLAEGTHRFEAHYGEKLIGPWPAARADYEARSPLNRATDVARPVIFFQGLDDTVVPPAQSERMAHALAANGLPVVLETFAGEGHGFRRPATIAHTLASELAFYARVLGLEAADKPLDLHYL